MACDPGGGVNCTPAEMAAHDLLTWQAQVTALLPGGVGAVQYAGTTPADLHDSGHLAGSGLGRHHSPDRRTRPDRCDHAMKVHKQHGMTLIELMVALAIGAFLMIGAITVFMQSRTTFRITESVARMQENARFALEAIEPDIRMAHYWGMTTDTTSVQGRVAPAAGNSFGRTPCGATGHACSRSRSAAATTPTGSAVAPRSVVRSPMPTRSSFAASARIRRRRH